MAILPLSDTDDPEKVASEELDIRKWHNCVKYTEDIVSVFRHWESSYDLVVDPFTSGIIWLSFIILCVHIMSMPSGIMDEHSIQARNELENSIDVLSASLQRLSQYWPLADELTGK